MIDKAIQQNQFAEPGPVRPFVAVIDDDAAVADAISAVIESQGWRPKVYASGEDFLDDLDLDHPPDCILLDLYLHGMSGVDVLWSLTDREAAVPVIVLTARPEGPLSAPAIQAGAIEVMTKPVRPEVLLDRIQDAMGEL